MRKVRWNNWQLIAIGLLTLMVAVVAFGTAQTVKLAHQIEDCISKDGKCAKENAKRTGQVVERIVDGTSGYNLIAGLCTIEASFRVNTGEVEPTEEASRQAFQECFDREGKARDVPGKDSVPTTTSTTVAP